MVNSKRKIKKVFKKKVEDVDKNTLVYFMEYIDEFFNINDILMNNLIQILYVDKNKKLNEQHLLLIAHLLNRMNEFNQEIIYEFNAILQQQERRQNKPKEI